MAGRQSAAMDAALALVASGVSVRKAADAAGVWYTSLYTAIKRHKAALAAKGKK